jgi:hypothetical protein
MDRSLSPRAPQGPSDAELNAVPPDPRLPPFGGSGPQLADLVAGPGMMSDLTAAALINIRRK